MSARAITLDGADALRRRLDIMICLLLESGAEPSKSVADKIERLIGFSLSDAEVAAIIGKAPNYVSSVRSRLKRKK